MNSIMPTANSSHEKLIAIYTAHLDLTILMANGLT